MLALHDRKHRDHQLWSYLYRRNGSNWLFLLPPLCCLCLCWLVWVVEVVEYNSALQPEALNFWPVECGQWPVICTGSLSCDVGSVWSARMMPSRGWNELRWLWFWFGDSYRSWRIQDCFPPFFELTWRWIGCLKWPDSVRLTQKAV